MKAGDEISFKAGTQATVAWEDAVASATALLVQTGAEHGLQPNITSTEKVETQDHIDAGEYLVVLRGVWETQDAPD